MNEFTLSLLPAGDGYVVQGGCPMLVGEAEPTRLSGDQAVALALLGERLAQGHFMSQEAAEQAGKTLFQTVFRGEIRELFAQARALARRDSEGLRLLVKLDSAPQLHEIPWELLHDGRQFIADDPATPIVRYLRQSRPTRSMRVEPPLRFLLTSACPEGQRQLDLEREEHSVRKSLEHLGDRVQPVFKRRVSMDRLLHVLRRAQSRRRPFHVWHHCGHGQILSSGEFCLVLEENGKPQEATAKQLGRLFATSPDLRLAVLNACYSGSRLGLATELARLNVPAVVGFRSGVFDRAARVFSQAFYGALAHSPVDVAVNRARLELSLRGAHPLDWTQPVTFSRTQQPLLFAPEAGPTAALRGAEPAGRTGTRIRFGGTVSAGRTIQIGRLSDGDGPGERPPVEIDFAPDSLTTDDLLQIGEVEMSPQDASAYRDQFLSLADSLRRRFTMRPPAGRTAGTGDPS